MVSQVIGTGNKLDIWAGMGWGYHQLSLPENELGYKQFFTVIQVVDSIDVGGGQTVLDLKPYFPSQAYRAGRLRSEMGGLIQQSWTLFSTPLCPYFQGA